MALQLVTEHINTGSYLLYHVFFPLVLTITNDKIKWNNDFMVLATDLIHQLMFNINILRQSLPALARLSCSNALYPWDT